ncbi:MAG: hypothetical protein UDG94_05895 [Peptococcaceae bacterium]|nr:hypothetical protein [Peptococcaceae bacterium]
MMIAAAGLHNELQTRLKKMAVGDILQVRTWKGDRGLTITCLDTDLFRLEEDGFQSQCLDALSRSAVLKAVKPIARREFPRSNKLRLAIIKEGNIDG